jgi:hypothetical protein
MANMNVEMVRPLMEAARLFREGFRLMDEEVRSCAAVIATSVDVIMSDGKFVVLLLGRKGNIVAMVDNICNNNVFRETIWRAVCVR